MYIYLYIYSKGVKNLSRSPSSCSGNVTFSSLQGRKFEPNLQHQLFAILLVRTYKIKIQKRRRIMLHISKATGAVASLVVHVHGSNFIRCTNFFYLFTIFFKKNGINHADAMGHAVASWAHTRRPTVPKKWDAGPRCGHTPDK
jgi:hypothetical protein